MTSNDIRKKFLDFFQAKGHKVLPSASLVPENDPTLLFTTAGMHPLVPYLLGGKHPSGQRLANVQKCLRTNDIDDIGDTFHHTFFEMLGNWSIGDPNSADGIGTNGYWKKQAIEWNLEFLTSTKWLGIPIEKIAISVFEGDEDAPFDKESYDIWRRLGIPEQKIVKLPKKNNWWGQVLGPCGPNTEMFYWSGSESVPETFDHENERWIEIWNDVFMEFNRKIKERDEQGEPINYYFDKLKQKNVDTGMGLERTLALLNGIDDNYKTELFWPIIERIEEISSKKYEDNKRVFRIIADHIRAATFILSEGILPSNVDQGYVLRRLIRRVIRYGKILGIENDFIAHLAEIVIDQMKDVYNQLDKNKEFIIDGLVKEEEKFNKTLSGALKKAEEIFKTKRPISEEEYLKIMQLKNKGQILKKIYHDLSDKRSLTNYGIDISDEQVKNAYITGKEAFNLYQSYGFPIEMIMEMAQAKNLFVTFTDFRNELVHHQELSRQGAEKKFKGGLADAGKETTKLHTAAHLMLAALRQVLGDQVEQKGSNITAERLRFDFNNPEKLTDDQIKKVEDIVNKNIEANLPVAVEEMSIEEAKNSGATGVFDNRYGKKVKVYTIGPSTRSSIVLSSLSKDEARSGSREEYFSREICGGPHIDSTERLGRFKIVKEESSSAGVRRIKAILE